MIGRRHARLVGAAAVALLVAAACAEQAPSDQPIQSNAGSSEGICARATEVREALLAAIDGVVDCAEVADEHLASIDGTLDLSGRGIETIDGDDLIGLDRLQGIDLRDNRLRQLPGQLFSRLASLCHVNVHDNPGAPFVYELRLVEIQTDDLRSVAVESVRAPPFDVNVLLRNEHVALSRAVVRISAGEPRSSTAQLGGVFGAERGEVWIADAAFASGSDCGQRLVHRGLELAFDQSELIVAATPTNHEPEAMPATSGACAGIPTQVIAVSAQSFARDGRIERLVTSRSGACYTALTIEPAPGRTLGGDCTLTEYVETISGGTSQTNDTDGDCGWLRIEHSTGQGGTPLIEGCDAPEMRLRVDAENFNRSGRVDLVRYEPESRCFTFLSAAQDPDRDEPYQFSAGQSCQIGTGVPLSGDCGSILIWRGLGRGGVNNEHEARADVARIRPAVEGEADAGRIGLIEACLRLPELSIRINEDSFAVQQAVHAYRAAPDEQCFMALIVAPDPHAQSQGRVAGDRQCVVDAAFQLLGFPYLLPTTRAGNCGGLIHFAWYMPAAGQITEPEFARLVKEAARETADSGTEGWVASQGALLCVNDVCLLEWSSEDHDPEP